MAASSPLARSPRVAMQRTSMDRAGGQLLFRNAYLIYFGSIPANDGPLRRSQTLVTGRRAALVAARNAATHVRQPLHLYLRALGPMYRGVEGIPVAL